MLPRFHSPIAPTVLREIEQVKQNNTWLMRDSFGKKAPDNMVFCVLDVKKGTLYQERTIDPIIGAFVESEALSFADLWNKL